MALKITLKPDEKVIIAGAVITNGSSTAHFVVKNKVPIMREKDILSENNANSPAKKIYYVIQLMYLNQENLTRYHSLYWDYVQSFLKAAPSSMELINKISKQILASQYYKALKLTLDLIEYELFLISKTHDKK